MVLSISDGGRRTNIHAGRNFGAPLQKRLHRAPFLRFKPG